MIFYNIGSLLKIIIGGSILFYLYNYVHIFKDPIIGLSFGFLGIFLICWGVSFYLFYIFQKLFSRKVNLHLASKSYKLALLFGLFMMINLALIILERWTKELGAIILIIFILLQIMTIKENE